MVEWKIRVSWIPLSPYAEVSRTLFTRPSTYVVAATGAGKSSVINAILGDNIVPTSKLFPTLTMLQLTSIQAACEHVRRQVNCMFEFFYN